MELEIIGKKECADERLNFIISKVNPHATCKIELLFGYSWNNIVYKSYAIYQMNEVGVLDLSAIKPLEGTYDDIDSMGLFHSGKLEKKKLEIRKERDYAKEYLKCQFTIIVGEQVKEVSFHRYFTNGDICCESIHQPFTAKYFYHNKNNSEKKILFLGGSEGILNPALSMCACLSNKGYDVLALQYFNPIRDREITDLPYSLKKIPIEYINKAIDWLQETDVNCMIIVVGVSKGAELALYLSTLNKKIKKVMAIAPSAYIWQSPKAFVDSSWSIRNKNVPYIHFIPLIGSFEYFKNMIFDFLHIHKQGYMLTYEFSRLFAFNKEKAIIKIEDTSADIYMFAGEKDSMYASAKYVEILKKRFFSSDNRHTFMDYIYKDSGHSLYTPFIFKPNIDFGGSIKNQLLANEQFWNDLLFHLSK